MDNLNKKIAEFGGFCWHDLTSIVGGVGVCKKCGLLCGYVWSGDEEEDDKIHVPDFPNDLNACFKYIVPKWIDIIMAEQECSSDLAYAILFKKWLQELELNISHAAPAFCKAVEKLIDRG